MLLLVVIAAVPAAALVTRPLARRETAPALRLRGGMGDIDGVVVAKVATGLCSVNAALLALAPEKAAVGYGVKSPVSGLSLMLAEKCGCIMMSAAIMAAMTLTGSSLPKAVGWSIQQGRAATLGFSYEHE
ncbi:hypothetical protein T484DRAFT_1789085 [Baffinella frigidus]|nr:hypothetical protein T484DRAFT_1789085 [Cryptophyta sp. CCMP2293]